MVISRTIQLCAAVVTVVTTTAPIPPQTFPGSGVVARLTVGGRTISGIEPSELHSSVIGCRIATPCGQTRRELSVDFGFFRSDPRIRNPATR